QARWLRSLLEAELRPETLYVDPSLTAVIETADPARVLASASRYRSVGELLGELRSGVAQLAGAFEASGRFALTAPSDVGRAEDWLLRGLVKQREGFMSRHFERRISLALARRPVATRPRGGDDRERARIGGVRLPADDPRRRAGRGRLEDRSPDRGLRPSRLHLPGGRSVGLRPGRRVPDPRRRRHADLPATPPVG